MAIGGDSSLAAERSLGMLNNNPIIHHGTQGVGRLRSSRGEVPRSSSQSGGMARLKTATSTRAASVFFKTEQKKRAVLFVLHGRIWQQKLVVFLYLTWLRALQLEFKAF